MLNYSTLKRITQKPSAVLAIGYPLVVFLLLALPSTSYARDAFIIVMLTYLWKDRQHCKEGITRLLKNPAILAGIALTGYILLTTLWSQPPTIHSSGAQFRNSISALLFWFSSCLYFYKDTDAMKRLFWVIGIGLAGNLLGVCLMEQSLITGGRLRGYGVLAHPNLISSVAVIHIAIGLHLNIEILQEKITAYSLLGISAAMVALSGSRGPMLALLTVALIWIASTPHIKTSHKMAVTILAAATCSFFAFTTNIIEVLSARGTSNRPIIWQETINYAHQHILLGWGWLNDFSQSVGNQKLEELLGYTIIHPHGLLISALYHGGLIGLTGHLIFLGFSAQDALKSKMRGLTFSLFAAVLLLTATDTHSIVTKRDFMLLIFWLPIALIIMTNQHTQKEKHQTPQRERNIELI